MTKLRYFNIGHANLEIVRLEELAGIPPKIDAPRLRFLKVKEANAEIYKLEAQLLAAGKYTPPPKATAKQVNEIFGPGVAERITGKTLEVKSSHIGAEANKNVKVLMTPASPPAASAPASPQGTDILAQFNALTDSEERTEFYRANKVAYDRAFNRAKRAREEAQFIEAQAHLASGSNPPPVTGDILSQFNSIKNPVARTNFYQANKAAYDAAWRAQHPFTP